MAKSKSAELKLPSPHDWRTTDTDEINKRRLRARDEAFTIANLDPRHPVFSNFRVKSHSGLTNCASKAACGPRMKRKSRSFLTNAKACCTSPSPSAHCSPTKWAS